MGEVETRVINRNIENTTSHNSDILAKNAEEHAYAEEANIEANMIGNLLERMELEGKLFQLKM